MGLAAIAFVVVRQLHKIHSSSKLENEVLIAIPFTLLTGVAGGYLLDLLLRGGIQALWLNPRGYGLTFYGWLIACGVFLLFYGKCRKVRPTLLLNLFLPSFALAQAFGRIGCFLGGCCYGRPAKFLGVSYPEGSLPYIHHGSTPLIPVQLYESAYLLITFVILFKVIRFNHRGAWYLILMPAGRFWLEFCRNDDRGTIGCDILSPSQWISAGLFLLGICWLMAIKYNHKKRKISVEALLKASKL